MYPYGLDYGKIKESSTDNVLDFISFLNKSNYKNFNPIKEFLYGKFKNSENKQYLDGFFVGPMFMCYNNIPQNYNITPTENLNDLLSLNKKYFNLQTTGIYSIDCKIKTHIIIFDKLNPDFKKKLDIQEHNDSVIKALFDKDGFKHIKPDNESSDEDDDTYNEPDRFDKITDLIKFLNSERYYCLIFVISNTPNFSSKICVPLSLINNKDDFKKYIDVALLQRNIEYRHYVESISNSL